MRLNSYKPVTAIYTDGFASNGTHNGGNKVVITTGPTQSPLVLDTTKRRESLLASSFEKEMEAMSMAVERIISNEPDGRTVMCSDSQSLLKAIANTCNDIYDVRTSAKLVLVKGEVVLQWVPGHMDVPGNEAADRQPRRLLP